MFHDKRKTMNILRLKASMPRSQRLNDFIRERVKSIKYKAMDRDVPPEEIGQYQCFDELPISGLYCEGTIFADPEINVMFRAWHDYVHLKYNLPFNLEGELEAAFIQCAELPFDWWMEKHLVMIEIGAQTLYNVKNEGSFVEDQIAFTNKVLIHGTI